MKELIKKLLSKFEPPANDWVLSRFGGYEGPEPPADEDEQAPVSSVARAGTQDASAFANGLRDTGDVSSNATHPSERSIAVTPNAERKSRVS